MGATGLAADQDEYRTRLQEQPDEQIDTWVMEAMRDIAVRRGVARVLDDFRRVSGLDDAALERAFAAGDGPPAVIGRDGQGQLMVPAIALHCLVSGTRAAVAEPRDVLVAYLVANFPELVYI